MFGSRWVGDSAVVGTKSMEGTIVERMRGMKMVRKVDQTSAADTLYEWPSINLSSRGFPILSRSVSVNVSPGILGGGTMVELETLEEMEEKNSGFGDAQFIDRGKDDSLFEWRVSRCCPSGTRKARSSKDYIIGVAFAESPGDAN